MVLQPEPPDRAESEIGRLRRDLAEAVDQRAATSQILEVIGRSLFDPQPVFETVVRHAVRLCDAHAGLIHQREGEVYELAHILGGSDPYRAELAEHPVAVGPGTLIGRVGLERRTVQIRDVLADPAYEWHRARELGGFRTLLGVPMLAGDRMVGVLTLWREEVEPFDDRAIDLVETFAAQAAIAIQHVRLFRELERRGRELEVASRHKSEFLASMSHELRTPLNAVIGFSDVLLERLVGELNERQEEYVRDIRDSGRHLLELINEILDLSKVEAGRMELDAGPVALPGLLEQAMAMVRERAVRHGIRLSLEIDPGVGVVQADELKLKQVVLNLLTNAVKFTGDGGSVAVTAVVDGGEARVTVSDTGVGVPEADRERIFEAFQRGGRTARRTQEGTGLGLTLSRRIVDLHGGRMWLEAGGGEGSTFGFAIPATAPLAAAGDAPLEPRHAEPDVPDAASAATVLVIEDDRRSAELLTLHLQGAGYEVVVARDGAVGLELARRLLPRAVVLDILLPTLDGWDLLARLKADPATADIPAVVVSMLDERGKGFALGAADYLVKPVDRDRVVGALARCAPAAGAAHAVAVIDDDARQLDRVSALLAAEGYEVLCAGGGEEGVELVRRSLPAVVLLDLLMPGLDGFAVVERLREDPATASIPIVVLTAKDLTSSDRERLAGRIAHLAQKGTLGRDELVALVGRLVPPEPLAGRAT